MGKPKAKGKGLLAAQLKHQPKKPNPFELKQAKSKFDNIGRRNKGNKKNILEARQEAVIKRKKTLLVEYRQLRKANSFVDKRLDKQTQDDNSKFAKLQQLKADQLKKKRGASKYNLNEEEPEQEQLTHLGASLHSIDDFTQRPDFEDMDEDVLEELMEQYNFGGGNGPPANEQGGAGPAGGKSKTRKEIMEEIIAKSKMYKALKQKQREEDEQKLEVLNEEFKELVSSAALAKLIKPPGFTKANKQKADNPEDLKYDVAARELAFEAKAQAGERVLTPEELAEKERLRLEKLERERLKRMHGDGGDDLGEEEGPDGGYAARRKRARVAERTSDSGTDGAESDSEDDDGEAASGSNDGDDDMELLSALEQRRRERAAGDHPLQESFRAAAAKLAAKYGVEVLHADNSEGEEGESEGGDSDEEDDERDSEESRGSEQDEDSEEDEGEGGESEDDEEPGSSSSHDDLDEEAMEDRKHSAALGSSSSHQAHPAHPSKAPVPELDGPLDLPYTPPIPANYQQFAQLVGGRSAGDLQVVIQRIRSFNAVALATESKRKLQEFYGILVQHFATLAGQSPIPCDHLDTLVPILLNLTSEVPYYAATVARARLKRLHERLTAALTGEGGPDASAWPGSRGLLQLKLFATLFPASDKRHPVMTPASLLLGKYLSQCPVSSASEAAQGLACAGLAMQLAAAAQRHCPEPLTFITDLIPAFIPAAQSQTSMQNAELARVPAGLLADYMIAEDRAPLNLYHVLGLPSDAAEFGTASFRLALLKLTVLSMQRAVDLAAAAAKDAFPELMAPLQQALMQLGKGHKLPPSVSELRRAVLADIQSRCSQVLSQRQPLWRPKKQLAILKEYNPRFEDDYVAGRDYDPDRQRAEAKKLKRQIAKEKRGAMRELRKDAVFMAQQRDADKAQVDAERLASERAFYSELQSMEADFKSGGQKGMNPHLKKKK